MTLPFVSPDWLHKRLHDKNTIVVDGSWYLPDMKRDAEAEYLAGHIPGAVRVDIEAIKDTDSSLPHMLPTPQAFSEYVGKLGIGETFTIVVYDGLGVFSAPRVRWMFRTFGAISVFILAGGLPAWKEAGYPLEEGPQKPRTLRTFATHFHGNSVADVAVVQEALATGAAQVVDARGAPRFLGEAQEPRPGLRSGHIPGSKNLPAASLTVDGKMEELKPADELRAVINQAAINMDMPVITTCGSGVTAAIVSLAFETLNHEPRALYDGSWAEWGSRQDLPIKTGKP